MKYVAPEAVVVDVEVLNVLLASATSETCDTDGLGEDELPPVFD